jgi:hypothetical protein
VTTSSHQDEPPDQQRAQALRDIDADHPGWHAWPGILGLLFARRPDSHPPLLVRSATASGLRTEIIRAERKRGLR